MNKAWIALPVAVIALVGCKSKTEPVSQVPPPAYDTTQPEVLPPVSIDQGAQNWESSSGVPGTIDLGPGSYEPEELAPAPPALRTYTVRKGDTLWSIATREYGNGQKWKDISAANPSIDPKKLAVGQQITLP